MSINCLLPAPQPGPWPTTQDVPPTGNPTGDLSVCRATPAPLSHTGQGLLPPFLWWNPTATVTAGGWSSDLRLSSVNTKQPRWSSAVFFLQLFVLSNEAKWINF